MKEVAIKRPTFNEEISVNIPKDLPEVSHNLDKLENFALQLKEFYSKLVFNDENINEATNERKKLNKLIEEVKRLRIDNVKAYKKPIEDFEKTAKNVEKLLGDAKDSIQVFIDKAESDRKMKKYEEVIIPIINVAVNKAFVEGYFIDSDKIEIDGRWYNKGFKDKDIEEDVNNQVAEIKRQQDEYNQGVEVIKSNLEAYNMTDKLDKYLERFKHTLNITEILQDIKNENDIIKNSNNQKAVIDNSSMFDVNSDNVNASMFDLRNEKVEFTIKVRGTQDQFINLRKYIKELGMEEI